MLAGYTDSFSDKRSTMLKYAVGYLANIFSRNTGRQLMRIRAGLSNGEQVATLGHELQHAFEIASTPSIVDDATLADAYKRIGFLSGKLGNSLAFETVAALQAGDRVRREFVASTERDRCDRATRELRVLARPRAAID